MPDFISHFHFLRPLWLLAIVPALLLCVFIWKQKAHSSQWQQLIPDNLLQHLLDHSITKKSRWQIWGLAAGWFLACLALAGPTWEKLPQPLHQSQSAVVIVLDLSPSMIAEDIKPSRLIRARYKLTDFLEQRKEGLTALVVYAGEAHVVSPLTDDVGTITNLLTALSPDMMPLRGSNVEMGAEKAIQLFKDSSISEGKILIVTDSIEASAIPTIKNAIGKTQFQLSILGVGSIEGAPIPSGEGGFAKDRSGNIVIAKLNQPVLIDLANSLNGIYTPLRSDNNDLKLINNETDSEISIGTSSVKTQREFDDWKDRGNLLAILLLPIIAFSFRRGWLLSFFVIALFVPEPSYALTWQDLWLRSDQQGQKSLQQDDAKTAAEQFKNPQWRGSAQYRDENYEAAVESFSSGSTTLDYYNRGNALAKAGKLPEAIEAYDQALTADSTNTDSHKVPKENIEFNKSLVEKLLEQQEQDQSSDSNNEENKNKQDKSQDNPDQQKKGDESKDSDEGDSENKNSKDNQSKSEQNSSDKKQQTSEDQSQNDQQNKESSTNEESSKELADKKLAGEKERKEQEEQKKEKQQEETQQQTKQSDKQQNQNGEEKPPASQLAQSDTESKLDNEQQQALKQWLRQVPDDPSGLLRRKFEYQHRLLRQQYQRGEWQPPENDAAERW